MVILVRKIVLEARKDVASTASLRAIIFGALKQLLGADLLIVTSLLNLVVARHYLGGHESPAGTASSLIDHIRDIISPVLGAFWAALEFLHRTVRFIKLSIVEGQAVGIEAIVSAQGASLLHGWIRMSLFLELLSRLEAELKATLFLGQVRHVVVAELVALTAAVVLLDEFISLAEESFAPLVLLHIVVNLAMLSAEGGKLEIEHLLTLLHDIICRSQANYGRC